MCYVEGMSILHLGSQTSSKNLEGGGDEGGKMLQHIMMSGSIPSERHGPWAIIKDMEKRL